MILSMTGFGRGEASSPRKKIKVELKSLNSKQLDLFMRVPAPFRPLEVEVRNDLSRELERGKIEFMATEENTDGASDTTLNLPAIKAYRDALREMGDTLGIGEPADWYSLLLRLPDAMVSVDTEADAEDMAAFRKAAMEAACALTEYRRAEGRKLYDFFASKIANISSLLKDVEPFEKNRVVKIKERLRDQLEQLHGVDYDKGRLEQELIFYIEKLDVSEEKQRLASHLGYFLETMGAPEGDRPANGQGKKLGFIAQEMGREINTLGSKSNDADMQKIVVRMKDELEQIKEQVLNVL